MILIIHQNSTIITSLSSHLSSRWVIKYIPSSKYQLQQIVCETISTLPFYQTVYHLKVNCLHVAFIQITQLCPVKTISIPRPDRYWYIEKTKVEQKMGGGQGVVRSHRSSVYSKQRNIKTCFELFWSPLNDFSPCLLFLRQSACLKLNFRWKNGSEGYSGVRVCLPKCARRLRVLGQ